MSKTFQDGYFFKVGDRVLDTKGREGVVVRADSIYSTVVKYDTLYLGCGSGSVVSCTDKMEIDQYQLTLI